MPRLIKAIVQTCDTYRAFREHMILRYEELWPDHPFIFRIAYQDDPGPAGARREYIQTPPRIPHNVLTLLADLDDEEWVYWCIDDKYPIKLITEKISPLLEHALVSTEMSGLMFCRCRVALNDPELGLFPGEERIPTGETLLRRKTWHQIWIHQLLKVKALRYLYGNLPEVTGGKALDALKEKVPMRSEDRLFVTKKNFAVFGESTSRGEITQNCYESIQSTGIELPERYRVHNGRKIILGKL